MLSIHPKDVPVAKLHSYLLSAVAPRPIALASTIDSKGCVNLSPFSFFNVFSANPPILIFSPARRVRDNTTKHTLENALETKEVVINIVNFKMVHQMSLSSTEYPRDINEFEKAGFTMVASDKVKPYRVGESPIQLECKINDVVALGKEGGAGNLIICELLKMHIDENYLNSDGSLDQFKLDLVARAGGSLYARANKGFFEIPKPLSTMGVGVDALPEAVRNSEILSGNDLGKLGNIEKIPGPGDVDKFAKEHTDLLGADLLKKHTFAKDYLEKNDITSAWKVLLMN